MERAWLLAVMVFLAFAIPARAQDDDEDLGKRVDDLEQKLLILERQKEVEQEAAGKAKDGAVATAGKDGFTVRSADGAYQLRLRGLLQTDGRFWEDDTRRRSIDTFEIRRARPILEATVGKFFDFRITPDFGEGKTTLYDAYTDWKFASWIRLRAGKFKPPVGLERLQSAADLVFVERALPTNLVPNRDVGFQLYGETKDALVAWAAGVFNGVPDGANVDVDTNDSKESAARVFLQPFRRTTWSLVQNLGLGVAVTGGTTRGTLTSSLTLTNLPVYRTAGQLAFFTYRIDAPPTLAGTVLADGRHSRVAPQLYWYAGRFGLQAEQVTSRQEVDRNGTAADLEHRAWQATGTFALTADRPTHRGIDPKRPFEPGSHGRGAFEIAVRAAALRIDDDTFPTFANPDTSARMARERGAGVNWYLTRNVRIMVDYIQTRFRGGAAAGADRENEKVLLNRFQVNF